MPILNCFCDHLCIEALLTVKLLQYNLVKIIVQSIYNDTVTPGMKINSLFCFMVCCTPQNTLLLWYTL